MIFLANENFPVAGIRLLRNAGHNVASIIEDSPGEKDQIILKRAHDENRIILTFDRDYGEEPAEILLNIIDKGVLSLKDRFTVVERNRIRQRPLSRKF
jgi:hypothetical protein